MRAIGYSMFQLAMALMLSGGVAGTAHAWGKRSCAPVLGEGWPVASQEYGKAVEHLLRARRPPQLQMTLLPQYGAESALQLSPGEGDADWTLRHVKADRRVLDWSSGQRQLRLDQEVWAAEVSMPAGLARRLLEQWRQALFTPSPQARATEQLDADLMAFVVDGTRISGPWPRCGSELHEQIKLLIKATEDDDERRVRRWQQIEQSLDTLRQSLAGKAG